MASTKHSGAPAQFNRRRLLSAAPAFGLAGMFAASAVPSVASVETPIAAMYREWQQLMSEEKLAFVRDDTGEGAECVAASRRVYEMEARIVAATALNERDLVMKILAATADGDLGLGGGADHPIWVEARALIAA